MKHCTTVIFFGLLLSFRSGLAQSQLEATPIGVQLLNRPDGIGIEFAAKSVDPAMVTKRGATYQAYTIPGEGTTFEFDRPILPAISRFVIVDPEAGLEFQAESDPPVVIRAAARPALCDDEKVIPTPGELTGLYPPNFVEFSDPVVVRGVRMVKVTTYPFQYDAETGDFLYRRNIRTDIRYNNDPPLNPVTNPNRPHRSKEFLKFIRAFAVNGDEIARDDPDYPTPYVGHYLVAAHTDALIWHQPFIEWRRKAGYKMDILALSANDAPNFNAVQNAIRARYNEYVDAGEEPFDELLLIGDRNGYDNLTVAPDKQLASTRGETIWGGPDHADYKLALLEGNDNLPDVGFGRFPSGSQNVANLVVGRTLSYEMNPRMQNPQWFTRGLNYSQHWGNGAESAWHITIHTNARWGEEVLKSLGFDDVNFYENIEWDQQGQSIGPVIRDELNAGSNLLVGRAENYFWRQSFQGVNNNTVFPINICVSGHGEWTAWNMFRTGDGNNLKGPVAATFGWGGPPTAPSSYVWMQMVSGTVLKDMPLGWARVFAITSIEKYFPDINVGQGLYGQVKTDVDMHGDPGIQPWLGVPRVMQLVIPQTVSPDVSMIEARVTTVQGGNVGAGVQVTLYHQGAMVLNNAGQYAAFRDYISKISYTNAEGMVRFSLDGQTLTAGKPVFITVTGRDIKPVLGEIAVAVPRAGIGLSDYPVSEAEGNGDDIPNPGEIIDVSLTAVNLGNRDAVAQVRAVVTSLSPFLAVEDNEISFGDLDAGAEADGDAPLRVTVSPRCPDSESRPLVQPQLMITFTSGNTTWKSILNLATVAPHFKLRAIQGSIVVQTQVRNLDLDIDNVGGRGAGAMTGRLSSLGIGVTVIRETATYPAIDAGDHARIRGNVFSISGNQIAVPGSKCPMMLVMSNDAGFRDTVNFILQVSTPRANAPQGPDAYGYIAFDDTDQDWDIAPAYDWEEINPDANDAEFEGERLNFRGQSPNDIGEALGVNLGFETQFYGVRYNRITVATNGFISMGSQPRITNYQNWPLDEAIGGGVGMVAPLWDDLRLGNGAGIFTYHDAENGRFIIEWNRMRGAAGNPEFTFQVILYDADVWITESGDPNILFQYKTVSEVANIRNGDTEWINHIAYASVGISSPEGNTGLSYHFHGEGPVTSAALAARRAILFSTAPRFKNGILYGRVTDHATGEPAAEATVFTQHGFVNTSDDEGYYRIVGAPAEINFIVTCRKAGYNDSICVDQWIDEGDSLEVNFDLLHPEFAPSVDRIDEAISPDEIVESQFTVANTGNGTLNWQVTRRLVGDANASPWDLRRQIPVSLVTGDSRIEGAVFVDDRFYCAGANGNDTNMIWVLDRDGALVDSFHQHGTSNFGHKDLEFDGELIWGSGEMRMFGFTPDGRLERQWDSNLNPASYIAWNSDDGIFYLSSTTTDIYGYDRDGNNLGIRFSHGARRIYGLGYWPDDPDDHPIYLLNQPVADTIYVEKLSRDPDVDDFIQVRLLPELPGNDDRKGIWITNEFDVYSWVFLTMTNQPPADGGDKLEIYQLEARRDWFDVQPESGILIPGEEQVFDFTFDGTNLPTVLFEGEVAFTHNAAGGSTVIPVTLDVHAGPGGMDRRTVSLVPGWNQISLNVEPQDNALPNVVSSLVEQGVLRVVKDGQGRFYRPDNNFNNIPGWDAANGYLLYLDADAELMVRGIVIAPDEPIGLNVGWNLRSYFPRQPRDVRDAVAGIDESLSLVKDGSGHFYMPSMDFSNMQPMAEGRGYYFRATEAVSLIYPADDERAAASPPIAKLPTHFTLNNQGSSFDNHSLLIVGDAGLAGMEIAARTVEGTLCGAARFDAFGRAGVAVWGDNPETAAIEGAAEGESFRLALWDGVSETAVAFASIDGDARWTSGGVSVAALGSSAPVEFGLTSAYPNPFNSSVRISYGIVSSGLAQLTIYDVAGRQAAVLADRAHSVGVHNVVWRADGYADGIYFAKLEQSGRSNIRKLFLVK